MTFLQKIFRAGVFLIGIVLLIGGSLCSTTTGGFLVVGLMNGGAKDPYLRFLVTPILVIDLVALGLGYFICKRILRSSKSQAKES